MNILHSNGYIYLLFSTQQIFTTHLLLQTFHFSFLVLPPSLLLIFLTFYTYHLYYTWMLCNPNNKKRMGKNFMLQVSTNELFTDISLDLSSSPVRHLLLSIPFTQLKNRKKQIPVKTWWNSDGKDAQTSVPVTMLYLIPVVFLSMNNLILLPHFVVSLFFLLFFFPAFLRKNSYIIGWGQF